MSEPENAIIVSPPLEEIETTPTGIVFRQSSETVVEVVSVTDGVVSLSVRAGELLVFARLLDREEAGHLAGLLLAASAPRRSDAAS